MDVKADASDNSDGWDEEFSMGDPLFHDFADKDKEASNDSRLRATETAETSSLGKADSSGKQQGAVSDILDLPTNQSDKSTEECMQHEQSSSLHRDGNQKSEADEIGSSSHQVSVGTETGGLIPMIARSSSTDESYFGPPDIHQAAMITSISTVSDGSEEERFVKVKPGDFEFESSKGSSQSGKDNLESDEQITLLTARCEKLQAQLAEKEDNYLAVKLQLESVLLEKNVESEFLSKYSQQISQLKDELLAKDQELMSIVTDVLEESSEMIERTGFRFPQEEGNESQLDSTQLSQVIRSLLNALLKTPPPELHTPFELSRSRPDLVDQPSHGYSDIEGWDDGLKTTPSAFACQDQINPAGISENETHQEQIQELKEMLEEKSSQVIILNGRCAELEASLSLTQKELSELRNTPKFTTQRSNPSTNMATQSSPDSFSNVELSLDDDNSPQEYTAEFRSDNSDDVHFETVSDAIRFVKPLMIRNHNLEEQLMSTRAELEELKERENDVIGGYQSMSASLVKAQLDCDELQKELSEKQAELENLRESIKTKTDQELARFKDELISKDEDLMELESELVTLRLASERKELELNGKVASLEAKVRELSERPPAPETTIAASILEELKANLATKEQELHSGEHLLQATREELSTGKKLMAELKDKHDKLEEKFKKAILTIKQRNAQLAEAKDSESRTSPQLSATDQSQLSEIQSNIESLEAQLKETHQTIKQQEELLAESEEVFKRMKTSLEREIDEKNEELLNVREQLSQVVGSMADKNADIEQLMKHTEELQALISRQNEDLSLAITDKDEEIRRAIQQYEEYYQQSQEQINQLTYNLNVKLDEISSTKEEFTELEKDLTCAQHQVGELKRLLQSSEQGQQQANASLHECQSALDEKKLELQLSTDERDALQSKVGELMLEVKKKTAAINQLDEALSVKSEAVNLLEFNVNECKATIADNNQQISELQNKLRGLLEELEESQRREEESRVYKESYSELVQLKKETNHLQLQIADSENRYQHLVQEFERKSTEMEMLKDAEVLGSRSELNQMKAERDSLLKDLQQSHELISMLENEKGNLSTSFQVAQTTTAEIASKLASAEEELKARDNLVQSKENEAQQLRAFVTSLQLAHQDSQSKMNEMVTVISQLQDVQSAKDISGPTSSPNSQGTEPPTMPEEIKKLLDEERIKRETLERKVELLQGKIYEIEVSEMKSFEECLMLKSWMREVELENIKYAEELRGYQSVSAWDGENPKVKTLQNEILRMVQSLEDRDKRSLHLTMEITRLLEERDGLQLKLSSALRQNIALNEKMTPVQALSDDDGPAAFEKEQLQTKLAQLEETNYLLDVDLKRAKEARRLVQEQLLLSQTSKFYRERSQPSPRQVPLFSTPPTPARNPNASPPQVASPSKPARPVPDGTVAAQVHDTV